jgi:hypothetical protein
MILITLSRNKFRFVEALSIAGISHLAFAMVSAEHKKVPT